MKRPYLLALTGSIGMGKSTTAGFFKEAGVPVWDADAAVHRLYTKGGAGVGEIAKLAPGAVIEGSVSRPALRAEITENPELLKKIEAVIHPLVAQDREDYIKTQSFADLIVLDIPLLFETGAVEQFDGVLVVTAPADIQRKRVLERPGITMESFEGILARQTPDAEKRQRADFVIDTSKGIEAAREDVLALIDKLKETGRDA